MLKLLFSFSLFLAVSITAPAESFAQCPMCKISMESNLNNGGTAGKGLNKGILYLFSMPYLIIGGLGYYWYKNQKLVKGEESSEN